MDGQTMIRELRQLLLEDDDSLYLDSITSYKYLNLAALHVAQTTKIVQTTQTITTVADQAAYDLNGDFLELYMRDDDGRLFVTMNDGTTNHFIPHETYEELVLADSQDSDYSTTIPSFFAFLPETSLDDRITGTATAVGAASGGECTLTDSTAPFADVQAGDTIHNTTDGSSGYVLSKTSSSAIVTALFGGTDNDWTNNDGYVIQPQAKMQIVFDPPPSEDDYTVTVRYVQRPNPVYSSYGAFKIPQHMYNAIVFKAAWLYKARDGKVNEGHAWNLEAERSLGPSRKALNKTLARPTIQFKRKTRTRRSGRATARS